MTPIRVCRTVLLIAAGITLLVSLGRLLGECRQWTTVLFGRSAGGGAGLFGIGWLIPVFGIWFGRRLAANGFAPANRARAFTMHGLGVVGVLVVFAVAKLLLPVSIGTFVFVLLATPLCALLALRSWPELAKVLFVYGITARVPVVVITFVAVARSWGTHYERLAPGAPEMSDLARTLALSGAQFGLWIPLTMLLGGIAATVFARAPHSGD